MIRNGIAVLAIVFLTMAPTAAQEQQSGDIPKAARALMDALLDHFSDEIEGLTAELPNIFMYDPPEMLPNGDIIMRRRPEQRLPPKDGEIDL